MGNHKFRLSDMVSSSWFHKLRGMSRANRRQGFSPSTKKSQTSSKAIASSEALLPIQHPKRQDFLPGRSSNYIPTKERREKFHSSPLNTKASDTHFPLELPKKSKKKSFRPCPSLVSSVSCNCALTSVFKSQASAEIASFGDCNDLCKPIISTSARFDRPATEENELPPAKKEASMQRSAVSENFVVIKSSENSMRDFMESMVEMIVENGIDEPSDLMELLACYLILNSEEYHEVIIRVFERILVCSD